MGVIVVMPGGYRPSVLKLPVPGVSRWRGVVRFAVWPCFGAGPSSVPLTAVIAGHPGAWPPGPGWFAGYARVCRCRGRAGFVIAGHRGADRERFEIRSFDACRRPLMWLVEEWTRHESATSVLVEPLSWGKSRSRDTTARAVASHGAARGCPRTPWNSMSMIPVRDTPRTHLVPKRSHIANFDPQSLNRRVLAVGLPGFAVVRGRPAGCCHRDDPRSRPQAARGPPQAAARVRRAVRRTGRPRRGRRPGHGQAGPVTGRRALSHPTERRRMPLTSRPVLSHA